MRHLALAQGAEFDRIREIAAALGGRAQALGDDCAVVPTTGAPLAISVDLSVEGVHFRRDWLSLEEIGWRAAASALSDLAADGAAPLGLLAAVGMPPGAADTEVAELMRGIGAAAAAVGALVLGGDLSSAPVWSAAITVLGTVERPVTRAGARAGDVLWVTGALGGARAALRAWQRGESPPPSARIAFAHPEPRIAAGLWLARHGARAMLDVSDGLVGDAGHLAAASRLAVTLDLDRLPLAPDVVAAARADAVAPPCFAAIGGEDYELLVALPPSFGDTDAGGFTLATKLPLTRVGVCAAGQEVVCHLGGCPVELRGFSHV